MATKYYGRSGSFTKDQIEYIEDLAKRNGWTPAQALRVLAEAGRQKIEADAQAAARVSAGCTQIDPAFFGAQA